MNIDFYNKKIELNSGLISKLKTIMRIMPILKLIAFILALVSFIAAFQVDSGKEYCFLLSFLLFTIFIYLQNKDAKYCNTHAFCIDLNEVYQNEIRFLQNDYSKFYDGEMFVDKKHEFSYDLDIFGKDSLFHRMNRTTTYEGKICLAHKLITIPESELDIISRQQALSELVCMIDFRFNFLAICKGFNSNPNKCYEYIGSKNKNTFLTSKKVLVLMCASISLTLVTTLLASFSYLPFWIPAILLSIQLFVPIIYFRKTNKHAAEVGKVYKNMIRYSRLLKLVEAEDFNAADNQSLKDSLFTSYNSLKALDKLASILERFDQRENAYALVLLNTLLLSDIFLLRSYSMWKQMYAEHMQGWIDALAELEARISLANYIFNKSSYCLPKTTNNLSVLIEAKEMGHPFINEDKLVTNDFNLYKSNFAIITGANMAGKSTFLRCAGVNYLMAVNGMRVCASEFKFSLFKLFSNMRNTDDLSSGISYFNAELIRIEQLIRFSRKHTHTLIILDEILKGTNSKDKLKGSIMFLNEMVKMPVTGIIATHDLDLAKLEEEKPDSFYNYCFEIDITDSIDYTYKIQRGVSKNLNATLLLQEILNKNALYGKLQN